MVSLLGLLSLLCWIRSGRSQHQDLKLEKIILFSRHGIRTPYGAEDMGQKSVEVFSTRPNARWGDDKNTGGRNTPRSLLDNIK